MSGLGVGELASRAGLAPSTVRYYERLGLLSPARRAPNGYRVFDEAALDELAFVARAKGIGLDLGEIADLVAAWPQAECRALQARLRTHLAGRIDRVRLQRADLETFEDQLMAVLGRLAAHDPEPGPCGTGCGCELDLDPAGAEATPWGCTLGAEAFEDRLGQWRATAAAATAVERTDDGLRLTFPAGHERAIGLAGLASAEVACCTGTRFELEVTADRIALTLHAPGSPELLERVVGRPVTTPP